MDRRFLGWIVAAWALASGAAVGDEDGDRPGGAVHQNRLARERSPYLRQHAANPVDWYPWGPEALERARREDRPLFLSIGYAACHWCHVMEHESFEDAEAARALNETFVCVKVDREERPDLDRLYMTSVQLLTGRGGWPMTVLLLPDGRPFWGGTYLPKPSVIDLSRKVRDAWTTRRAALEQQAAHLAEETAQAAQGVRLPDAGSPSDADLFRALHAALAAAFDPEHGGYGDRPKFPPHAELLLALESPTPWDPPESATRALFTLERMADGGIHDQVGGGFHRYATDDRWLLPHFEKMLYDNAILARAYARGYAKTRDRRFARVAQGILAWAAREMRRPDGGFASSLDADTQGHEGLTYTWTTAELRAVLPPEDAALAIRVFGVTDAGNFAEEATGRTTGRNVLHWPAPPAETARREKTDPEALEARLDHIRRALLQAREKRAQPGLDDKVIVAWNALLVSAFVACGTDLGDSAWTDEGRRLAEFLWTRCRRADGALLRFPAGSGPEIPGFCEDHVHLGEAMLDLAEATREERWLAAARDLGARLLDAFEDREGGGFWTTSETAHEALFARTKEAWDSPIPSDQGTAARFLLRLAAKTGDARWREAADRTLAAYRPLMARSGMARGIVALFRATADRAAIDAKRTVASPADAHVRVGPAEVDLWLERVEARRGSRVRFALRAVLDAGWHVNSDAPADPSLVATRVSLPQGSPVRLAATTWPPGGAKSWEGTIWVRGEVEVPADAFPGPRKVAVLFAFQPCDATSCREPEEARLEAPLRFSDADGEARHGAVFGKP